MWEIPFREKFMRAHTHWVWLQKEHHAWSEREEIEVSTSRNFSEHSELLKWAFLGAVSVFGIP